MEYITIVDRDTRKYVCNLCKKTFANLDDINRHIIKEVIHNKTSTRSIKLNKKLRR